ncbi:MAG TPA: Npt1/Npt2 family nucleotide transporter [Polyangia bacterium]|nr:Npt1/Npt2 family nucleotide transporter [Polyangia bacterium]
MRIRGRLERVVDIRPGEGVRTILMFFTVLLLIASYTMTKAVRDAVFLAHFGLTQLSYMMIGIAVVAGIFVSTYKRLTAGRPRNLVALFTNSIIALSLVAMAIGLQHKVQWISWGLYFWSAVFGLVLVADFWLLANDLFDAREAKRLFPVIGSGAILGGFCGGALAGWLAKPLGAPRLLYFVAAELVGAALLSNVAWRYRRADVQRDVKNAPKAKLADGFAILRNNRYVQLIAGILLCMTVCYTIVQWQYKGIAKIHFGSRRDDMTAFFGTFAAVLNLGTFVLQILGTPRLLRRWGVGFGLRVLPSGIGLGALLLLTTAVLPLPMLAAAATAMLLCDGFRFSVDKASTELLYLPISRAVKDRAKAFIDTFVDRFAGALASFLWLFMTFAFHIDKPDRIVFASLLTLAVAAVWMVLVGRARVAYIAAYREMLATAMKDAPAAVVAPPEVDLKLKERVVAEVGKLATANADDDKRLRAIARLARRTPDLALPPDSLAPALLREADVVERLALALQAATVNADDDAPTEKDAQDAPKSPLAGLLHIRLRVALRRLFDLLALSYPTADVRAAEAAIVAESSAARAGALELLDNVITGKQRRPVLDALETVVLPRRGKAPARDATLAALFALHDEPLRAALAKAAQAEGIAVDPVDNRDEAAPATDAENSVPAPA